MPEFSVRLVIRVAADEPEKAVPTFITHLVENGMTDWVYQVGNPDTGEVIGYFDGFGLPVNVDDLPSGRDQQETPEPQEQAQEQTPVQTTNDQELLALAERLNDEPAEPTPPQE